MNSNHNKLSNIDDESPILRYTIIPKETQSIAKKMRIKAILSNIDPELHRETEILNILCKITPKQKAKK